MTQLVDEEPFHRPLEIRIWTFNLLGLGPLNALRQRLLLKPVGNLVLLGH